MSKKISIKNIINDKEKAERIIIFFLFVLLFSVVLLFILILPGKDNVFGSYVDWNSQHTVLPDYFRQKFYETGSLTEGFAFELGAGTDPYALAYHGMLDPVLLPSYLFPSINMPTYVMISSVVLLFSSLILMYFWMREQKFGRYLSFFASVLLAFSAPFFFHFHKQVMFVDYFPFLLLSLIGIDRFLLHQKRLLFIVSFALAVLTSMFFVPALVSVVTVYYIYRYLEINKGSGKHPFKSIGSFMLTGFASCMLTMIVILPALSSISGERETNLHTAGISFVKLFIPNFRFEKVIYSNYGAGLSAILLFALFALFFLKRPSTSFLSAALSAVCIFPFISFVLNAFLYDRGKIIIAFLPLYILVICLFIQNIKIINIPYPVWLIFTAVILILTAVFDFRILPVVAAESAVILIIFFFGRENRSPIPVCSMTVSVMLAVCIIINTGKSGQYLKADDYNALFDPVKEELISDFSESGQPVRIADLTGYWYSCNQIYDKDHLRTSIYASASNIQYLHLQHELCMVNPSPHKIVSADVNDVFFSMLMGHKLIIGDENTKIYGYNYETNVGDRYLYSCPDAYSIAFASDKLMSVREFEKLSPADKQLALTGYIVVEDDLPDIYSSPFEKTDIGSIPLDKDKNGYIINSDSNIRFSISPENKFDNTIYAVNIKYRSMTKHRIKARVNGILNVFSGYDTSFPNDNDDMWFIISDGKDRLDFELYAGNYAIDDISVYAMNSDELDKNMHNMQMAEKIEYDGNSTMTANICTNTDGIMMFTVPFSSGLQLTVDGSRSDIEITDKAFIGCRIPAGEHTVVLTYKNPLQIPGIICSITGCCLTVILVIWDKMIRSSKKRMNNENK